MLNRPTSHLQLQITTPTWIVLVYLIRACKVDVCSCDLTPCAHGIVVANHGADS